MLSGTHLAFADIQPVHRYKILFVICNSSKDKEQL